MFASNSKPKSNPQNQSQGHGSRRGWVEITSIKGEEVDTITMEVRTMEFSTSFLRQLRISLHRIFLLRTIRIKILLRALKLIVHHVRIVGNLDIKL